MIGTLKAWLGAAPAAGAQPARAQDMRTRLAALNADPYLQLADEALGLISVFDDLKYDRSDADMLSPPMRRHAIAKLGALGFRQVSGNVLADDGSGARVVMPKSHALGASPFDITRYTPKGPSDYYLLTPTQTACQFVDSYPLEDAVTRIKALIAKHPVNLVRMEDYLEKSDSHRAFLGAIGHLKFVQREAVTSEPLQRRRALR
jgi:hypothetical protein